MSSDGDQRATEKVRLPLWGSVVASDGATPWLVVDGLGDRVEPVAVFLRDLAARDRSASSVRSYAMALLLGMHGADIDWGNQLIRVIRKGTRAEQWLPASADAFVWLRLYFSDIGDIVRWARSPRS